MCITASPAGGRWTFGRSPASTWRWRRPSLAQPGRCRVSCAQVLDAEAEYLAAEVASAAKEAADAGGAAETVKGAVERLSAPEMKVLLRQYVQRCVDGQERERAASAALREAQLEVAAKARELQQVESGLRTKELDFDRRVSARCATRQDRAEAEVFRAAGRSRPGPPKGGRTCWD